MIYFISFIAVVALMILSLVINGFVLMILWGWFVVPSFNVPELTLVYAMGIKMLIAWMTQSIPLKQPAIPYFDNEFLTMFIAVNFILPFVYLGIGFILTWFI